MRSVIVLLLMALTAGTAAAGEGLEKAQAHYGRGEYRQAANLLRDLARSSPKDAEVRFRLSRAHTRLREWKQASRELEEAVKIEPRNARYHLWLGRAYGDQASRAFFTSAFSLARKVVREFETARDLAPRDIDVRFDLLEYYLQAPGVVGGGKDKAEAEVKAIAEIDPSKKAIAEATLYIRNKEWEKAETALLRATVEHPRHASSHRDLAEYRFDRKDYRGALDSGLKALGLDPKSRSTALLVASARVSLGVDLDEADRSLAALAGGPLHDGDPSYEEVHYWIGASALARGDRARAREAFQTALRFNPEHTRAKDALAQIP
ncbi:MAG: tetratricopeptide repeat protein [Acidobacteria bacterium]|jgi:tetratricopeptide (TPR) repeat protein|nr:tetratricopeptide repeat protein [Acidobacteriota bacterium]